MAAKKHTLTSAYSTELLQVLKERFEKNMHRHEDFNWAEIEARLKKLPAKLWSLNEMERTGGEPDVLAFGEKSGEIVYCDCSVESPSGRRSLSFPGLLT